MRPVTKEFKSELVASLSGARRYALTLTQNAADADDLVQSAVERALENASSFEYGTNFKGWFNRIIKNLFLDERKSHRVSKTILVGDDETGIMEGGAISQSEAETLLEVDEVQEFLRTLPNTERSVVMLWAEGYSYEEIAGELDITRSNAGVILCRARKAINDKFKRC